MGIGLWQLIIILAVVLIVFGAGRLPNVMGDFGKGIRKFKEGLTGDAKDKGDTPFLSSSEDDETKPKG